MDSPPISTTRRAWRAAVNMVKTIQQLSGLRSLAQDSKAPSSTTTSTWPAQPNLDLAQIHLKTLRNVVPTPRGTDTRGDPDQVIPGVREYLFPDPIAPIKGLSRLEGLIFGPRGFLQGIKEMFVERRLGRGFAKALASAVFIPFQLIAVVVDAPRFAGDHIVEAGKKQVIQSIRFDGMKQSLHTMLGGAIQMVGGLVRLALPAAIVTLGVLSTGWAGVLGAAIFEAVYLGEDLAKLGAASTKNASISSPQRCGQRHRHHLEPNIR